MPSAGWIQTLPQRASQKPATAEMLAAELQGVAAGDAIALERFFDATNRLVHGLALGILRDPQAAEEVVLDVYLQVWRQAGAYDSRRGSPLAWLTMLARSRAIDRRRAHGPEWTRTDTMEAAAVLLSESNPEAETAVEERSERVRAALAQLPAAQREAIVTAFFSGLSHSEVAAVLGAPLGTVKTRIRTGMMRLRELLEPEREALR